jgi:hypothetical protein
MPLSKFSKLCFRGILLSGVLSVAAFGSVIDFQTLSGPTTYMAAGNEQTLTISTSIGNVLIEGGVILKNATNMPADETSIYGTTGNAEGLNIGITSNGSGLTNPITIIFPVAIQNFFVDVLNGNTNKITYRVSDNQGNSQSFALSPNANGGNELVGFAATGTVVTIGAATGQTASNGQMAWDFFIDNIHFDEPLPPSLGLGPGVPITPEPASFALLGAGLVGIFFVSRRRKTRVQ